MARSRNGVTPMRNKRIRPTRSRSSSSYTSSLMGRDLFTADVSFGSSFFGTSSGSTEPALQDDRWEEDASGINSEPILVHSGVEVRGGKFVYQENTGPAVQVAGPPMGDFGKAEQEEPAAQAKASSGKVFAPKPGETHTFLDREYGSTIWTSRKNALQSWKSVAEVVAIAATEVRNLAKGYYANFDELRRKNQMLPEVGVRIVRTAGGEFTYREIIVGNATYDEDISDGRFDPGRTIWKERVDQYKTLLRAFIFIGQI